jgi:hypothetical protein
MLHNCPPDKETGMIVDMHCHPFFGSMIENEDMFRLMTPMLIKFAAKMGLS